MKLSTPCFPPRDFPLSLLFMFLAPTGALHFSHLIRNILLIKSQNPYRTYLILALLTRFRGLADHNVREGALSMCIHSLTTKGNHHRNEDEEEEEGDDEEEEEST